MNRHKSVSSTKSDLDQSDYDQLAIDLAASLRLYLELLALAPFSPDAIALVSDLAKEVAEFSHQRQRRLQ